MDSGVGVAIEDEPRGEVSLREVIALEGNEAAGSRLLATADGFELMAYSVYPNYGTDRLRRLYRASLDGEGHALSPVTVLAAHQQLACDAAVADSLIIVCSEYDYPETQTHLRSYRCELPGGSCDAPVDLTSCALEASTPLVIATAEKTEAIFACDEGDTARLMSIEVVGGLAQPSRTLVDGVTFARGRPALATTTAGRVIAWLDYLYTFDASGQLIETSAPLIDTTDPSTWIEGASWDLAIDSAGITLFGAYGLGVFEQEHGDTTLCRIDGTTGEQRCDTTYRSRPNDGSQSSPGTSLVTRGTESDLIYSVATFGDTDLVRARMAADKTITDRRPLLPPLGDLELECAECDESTCYVLSSESVVEGLRTEASYTWWLVPRDGSGARAIGPAVRGDPLAPVACGSGGAALQWPEQVDAVCRTSITWLPRDGSAPWISQVDSCDWAVFAEPFGVRLISYERSSVVHRLVTSGGPGEERSIVGLSNYSRVRQCGASYMSFVHDAENPSVRLVRWTPDVDDGFFAVAEHRFDAPVSSVDIACDASTVLLLVNQEGYRSVYALSGSELVPWPAPVNPDWAYSPDWTAVHSQSLLFADSSGTAVMRFDVLNGEGQSSFEAVLPGSYDQWFFESAVSAGDELLVLWRSAQGDAWLSTWR